MTTWVMIILLGGNFATYVPFKNVESCQIAVKQAYALHSIKTPDVVGPSGGRILTAFCVSSGGQ